MDVAVVIAVVVVESTIPYRDNGVNEPQHKHTPSSVCVCWSGQGCISQSEVLVWLVFIFRRCSMFSLKN